VNGFPTQTPIYYPYTNGVKFGVGIGNPKKQFNIDYHSMNMSNLVTVS